MYVCLSLYGTFSWILFIKCLSLKLVNVMSSMKIGTLIIVGMHLGTNLLNIKLTVLCFDFKWHRVYISKIYGFMLWEQSHVRV